MSTPITLGNTTAPHLYRVGVEARTVWHTDEEGKVHEENVIHVDVHARTRWAAVSIAEKDGYVVRDVNMIG